MNDSNVSCANFTLEVSYLVHNWRQRLDCRCTNFSTTGALFGVEQILQLPTSKYPTIETFFVIVLSLDMTLFFARMISIFLLHQCELILFFFWLMESESSRVIICRNGAVALRRWKYKKSVKSSRILFMHFQ